VFQRVVHDRQAANGNKKCGAPSPTFDGTVSRPRRNTKVDRYLGPVNPDTAHSRVPSGGMSRLAAEPRARGRLSGASARAPSLPSHTASMRLRQLRTARGLVAALALLAAGCDRAGPSDPAAPPPASRPSPLLADLLGRLWHPLACSEVGGSTARAVIGPDGGTLAAGGFRIDFPEDAVSADQAFVLTVVPGTGRRIEAHAEGLDRFDFARPVTVTMDLRGCGLLLPPGLHAWHLDTESGVLLEDMGGTLDLLGQRLRFRTPHFSGYTIAWRTDDGGDGTDSLP
jgi:hypothetical protein